jgi:hypothetical protein
MRKFGTFALRAAYERMSIILGIQLCYRSARSGGSSETRWSRRPFGLSLQRCLLAA